METYYCCNCGSTEIEFIALETWNVEKEDFDYHDDPNNRNWCAGCMENDVEYEFGNPEDWAKECDGEDDNGEDA